jgi:hypothetical protein
MQDTKHGPAPGQAAPPDDIKKAAEPIGIRTATHSIFAKKTIAESQRIASGRFNREALPDAVAYFEAQGLPLSGRGVWRDAHCPFHDGDALRVNSKNGFWCCMNCHARGDIIGFHMAVHCLGFVEAAKDLNAWQDDGTPGRSYRPTPLPAREALQVLALESNLTAVAACNLRRGVTLTDADRARLITAAARIAHIAELFQ